jgi:purine-binding chemotaxis protein CheW
MDFLEIRRKAKARAAREGKAAPPAEAAPEAVASAAAAPRSPPPPSAQTEAPAGRPEGAVAPEEKPADADRPPEPASDARFTTWRPGSGERPFVPAPGPPSSDLSAPGPARATRAPVAPPLAPPNTLAAALPAAQPPASAGEDREAGGPRPPPALRAGEEPARPAATPRRSADPLEEFFFRPDEESPLLGALPGGEPVPADPRDADAELGLEEYLTFRLGEEEYGVSIGQVHEVLKAPAITEVPRAPAGILGVVTVRGEVVAVFDPRRRLGLPGAPPSDGAGRIVIVDDGAGPCGLLVDTVASVVRLSRRAIEPCPQGIGGASGDCLAGIGRERGRLFTVLDLPALLRRAPAPARRPVEGRAHGVR